MRMTKPLHGVEDIPIFILLVLESDVFNVAIKSFVMFSLITMKINGNIDLIFPFDLTTL